MESKETSELTVTLQEGSNSQASLALTEIAADQSAARQAAKKPLWFMIGIGLCMGVLVGTMGIRPLSPLIPPAPLLCEIALIILWRRSMKVRLGVRQMIVSWPITIAIFIGLLILPFGLIALLIVPTWPVATLIWLAPLCGLTAACATTAVGQWNTRRWLAKQS